MSDPTNTQAIDKEARAAIRALCGLLHCYKTIGQLDREEITRKLIPLPAEGEREAKPEAGEQRVLKWGARWVRKPDGDYDMLSQSGGHYLEMYSDGVGKWHVETGDDTRIGRYHDSQYKAVLVSLNACQTPPPDWNPEIQYNKPQPAADKGAERVKALTGEVWRLRSALASVEGYHHTERTDAEKITQMKAIAGDALNIDPVGVCSETSTPSPKPKPEGEKPDYEAEAKAWRECENHSCMIATARPHFLRTADFEKATEALSAIWIKNEDIEAKHRAEMEAVKKGASRD